MQPDPKKPVFSLRSGRQFSSNSIVEVDPSPLSPFIANPLAISSSGLLGSQETLKLRIELERVKSQLLLEQTRYEKALATKDARIVSLEQDRKYLLDKEAQLRSSKESLQNDHKLQINEFQSKLNSEKRVITELQNKALELDEERKKAIRELEKTKISLDTLARQKEVTLMDLQNQIVSKEKLLNQKDSLISQLKEDRTKKTLIDESSILLRPQIDENSLLEKLCKLESVNRRLACENEILRESTKNFKVMEEKLYSAQQRIEKYREIETHCNQLEAKMAKIEANSELHRNDATFGKEVKELLEKTASLAKLQESFGMLEAKFKVTSSELESLKGKISGYEVELKCLNEENPKLKAELHFAKQSEAVLRSELQILKEQIDAADRMEKASQTVIRNLKRKVSNL